MIIVERVKSLEINEGKTTEQIVLMQSDINDLKQQYMSHLRPANSMESVVFPQPPKPHIACVCWTTLFCWKRSIISFNSFSRPTKYSLRTGG
jgi:hypothetical protein